MALSVDTMMRQRLPFNSLAYFVMIFSATVVYYTYAYTSDSNPNAKNERSDWYANNKRFVKHSQVFIGLLFAISFLFYSATDCSSFLAKPFLNWLILSIFPCMSLIVLSNKDTHASTILAVIFILYFIANLNNLSISFSL